MKLEDLGYNEQLEKFIRDNQLGAFEIGRVVEEQKERYKVSTPGGEWEAEIIGNMRFTAKSREDFPAVGDWVTLTTFDDLAIIHQILPRFSMIKRAAAGQQADIQVIATNIDCALILQSVDRDFNLNRLERYLTICNTSRVNPLIVLSKIDLISSQRLSEIISEIQTRMKDVSIVAISNESQEGYKPVKSILEKGKTYCLLGSSGVGKSSLLNNLSGRHTMQTDFISQSTQRGRHVTTHRELIVLDEGAIIIDNPGMREVGMGGAASGLEITFDQIVSHAHNCKFKDCTHTSEIGCAVISAVEKGEIDQASYLNYLKMENENAHFESTAAQRREKDKGFGKMMKNYKKDIRKNSH